MGGGKLKANQTLRFHVRVPAAVSHPPATRILLRYGRKLFGGH